MTEKKMTICYSGRELEWLEKKYDCDRETLNLAIEYARAQFEANVEFELHDAVEDAARDIKGTQI